MEKGMRNRSPWDLSFGWSQIEAVIELLFLFSGGPTSNHTRVQMRGDQVCDAEYYCEGTSISYYHDYLHF